MFIARIRLQERAATKSKSEMERERETFKCEPSANIINSVVRLGLQGPLHNCRNPQKIHVQIFVASKCCNKAPRDGESYDITYILAFSNVSMTFRIVRRNRDMREKVLNNFWNRLCVCWRDWLLWHTTKRTVDFSRLEVSVLNQIYLLVNTSSNSNNLQVNECKSCACIHSDVNFT